MLRQIDTTGFSTYNDVSHAQRVLNRIKKKIAEKEQVKITTKPKNKKP